MIMNELVYSCAVTKLSWRTLYQFREWSCYISIKPSWIATGLEIGSSKRKWKKYPFPFPLVFNSRRLKWWAFPNTSDSIFHCFSVHMRLPVMIWRVIENLFDKLTHWPSCKLPVKDFGAEHITVLLDWTSCRYIWIYGLHVCMYIYIYAACACIKICINMKKNHNHLWRCMNM